MLRTILDWLFSVNPPPPAGTDWHQASETIKNFVEALVALGGVGGVIAWLFTRKDRATDVLFELEEKFTKRELAEARSQIETEQAYREIISGLRKCVLVELAPKRNAKPRRRELEMLGNLDELLRFYVFLHGVRKARQVPSAALRASYRYWLTFYFHPERTAFRAYVDWFYPTVSAWLRRDERKYKRFFDPTEFGWIGTEKEKREQLRRGIKGREIKSRVLVVTGAGISAESGLPTFRGKEGYWRKLNPRKLATRESFETKPDLVWEWYQERRQKIRDSKPNPAHVALVELASNCTDFLLVTQNVDDLHERAKHEKLTLKKEQIVHIHGEIFRSRCMRAGCNFERWDREPPAEGDPQCPTCPKCGSFLRPGVVWFDEDNDPHEEQRVDAFLDNGCCDVVLVIGTTATFDYIRRWVLQAVVGGAWLIEINPHETPLSRFAHHVVRKRAAKALPDMVHHAVEHGPLSIG